MELKDFDKISDSRWLLPKSKDKTMNVEAEIFASEEILKNAIEDSSMQQVVNVSSLPGILSNSLAMPDIHYGYGFCIGGVAAFPAESGIVSPGGVGYDINCGVRLLTTGIESGEIDLHGDSLGRTILRDIPTGLSRKGNLKLSKKEFFRVLKNGAEEIVNSLAATSRILNLSNQTESSISIRPRLSATGPLNGEESRWVRWERVTTLSKFNLSMKYSMKRRLKFLA